MYAQQSERLLNIIRMEGPSWSGAAKNFIRKGPANDVVSHCRRLKSDCSFRLFSNRWKL